MSKRGYITRYLLLLKKLKQTPYASFDEISDFLQRQTEALHLFDEQLQLTFSLRTLQRDIREIRDLFGVDIVWSKKNKGYVLQDDAHDRLNFQRVLEAFDLFHSLELAADLQDCIQPETRRGSGTAHLPEMVRAIRQKRSIRFVYEKFSEEKLSRRVMDPYLIKEFRQRWYVVGRDHQDGKVKSFGLDRIQELEIAGKRTVQPDPGVPQNIYDYAFGITATGREKPQRILLSFEPLQGKYIKSLPLHHSQTIVRDTPDELQIELSLCVSHELVMELLSFGATVKVLKPIALAQRVQKEYVRAMSRYQ